MSDDRDSGTPFGSLLELFPHLAEPLEPLPYEPVHVRALAFEDHGVETITFVVWDDPGGAAGLRRQLGARIEAALLAYLCRPADGSAEPVPSPARLRVVFFGAVPEDAERALQPFGLAPSGEGPAELAETLRYARAEAPRVGREPPDAPTAVFVVPAAFAPNPRGALLARLESRLAAGLDGEVWGARPGHPFHALSAALVAEGEEALPRSVEAIERIEALAGQLAPGVLRLYPPLVFQALADAVAVVAATEFGRRVDWAESELDDAGFASPPLFRAKLADGFVHIPIGEHLLRWCVMPLAPGEIPPSLGEWVLDQFGDRATSN